ncbi:alpha subunit of phenylphosphate carboxylase [Thermoascus aurantiacus ATCC 26904]
MASRTWALARHGRLLRRLSTTSRRNSVREANQAPHLSFRSMLDTLRQQGDLVDVHESVSPDLEVGAITRRVYETRAPAPLFHNVAGTDPQTGLFRILGAPVGLRRSKREEHARLALSIGLPATSTPREIVEKMIAAKKGRPLPPVPIANAADAPCKQNILRGADIDLNRWPIPRLHALDGGNYLGTYGFHVVQTPDRSWTSWSISRAMHHGREPRALTCPVLDGQHIAAVHRMWADRGQETPWAMVLGGPPAAAWVAGMPLPYGVSEDGYIGALSGTPLEVVRCETNDLYVPANAEVVIEGRISNTQRVPEGPMGEYHGYASADEPVLKPLFHIDCVTFRDQPVVPICVAGVAPDETHTVWGASIAAEVLGTLREADFPVDFVWLPYEAHACWIVVSVDIQKLAALQTTPQDLCRRAGELIFSTHAGWEIPKVFLVGDDVDITDIDQVLWAVATRYRPGADEYVFDDTRGLPMLPYMTKARREQVPDPGRGGKSVVNLLLPQEYAGRRDWVRSSFEGAYPAEVRERVLARWEAYGFRDVRE